MPTERFVTTKQMIEKMNSGELPILPLDPDGNSSGTQEPTNSGSAPETPTPGSQTPTSGNETPNPDEPVPTEEEPTEDDTDFFWGDDNELPIIPIG